MLWYLLCNNRKFLTLRITPDMERKLLFLTQEVKFGHHSRYEAWFQRSHLSSPSSQTLRADLVRYITAVIHPTNELLSSPVTPRWAVVGGLLTTCTSSVISAQVKLALFYDWMFFDPNVDNIMNIEPAALLMHHSIRSHPQVNCVWLSGVESIVCTPPGNCYSPRLPLKDGFKLLPSVWEYRERVCYGSLDSAFEKVICINSPNQILKHALKSKVSGAGHHLMPYLYFSLQNKFQLVIYLFAMVLTYFRKKYF